MKLGGKLLEVRGCIGVVIAEYIPIFLYHDNYITSG